MPSNFGLDGVQWDDVSSVSVKGWKPYDAEVEYVESDGSNWVETDYVPTAGAFAIDMTALTPWRTGYMIYFGAYISNSNRLYATNEAADKVFVAWQYGTAKPTHTFFPSVTRARTNYTFSGNTHPFFVFYMSNSPSAFNTANARFRSARFWDSNGDLALDLVPVRVGTVGYLYDRANPTGGPLGNGLYGSATSTPLVAGPDVAYGSDVIRLERGTSPKELVWQKCPYVKDGLIAWWDGIWNAGVGIHDASATVWRDLVGDRQIVPATRVTFGANCLIFPSNGGLPGGSARDVTSLPATQVEIVFAVDGIGADTYGEALVLTIPDGSARYGLAIQEYGPNVYFTMKGGRILTTMYVTEATPTSVSYTRANPASISGWTVWQDGQTLALRRQSIDIGVETYFAVGGRGGGKRLIGRIHCIRLYNRALTDAEVAANYAVDAERFNLTT